MKKIFEWIGKKTKITGNPKICLKIASSCDPCVPAGKVEREYRGRGVKNHTKFVIFAIMKRMQKN